MPRVTKAQDKAGFAFATKVYDHHQADFRHLIRFQTPTDRLVALANDTRGVHPPFSLATSRGQRHALKCFVQVDAWKKDIAFMAYSLQGAGYALVDKARESRSRELGKALVDMILTRVAMERNPKVILSNESIQIGLHALTGHNISLTTVRSLLKVLTPKGSAFSVVTQGERGRFRKATKIAVKLPDHSGEISALTMKNRRDVDDWLLERGQWVVRVMRHEALLRDTQIERIAEYRANTSKVTKEVEVYLRKHSVRVPGTRRYIVNMPGDIEVSDSLSCASEGASAPPCGPPIVTTDSFGPKIGAEVEIKTALDEAECTAFDGPSEREKLPNSARLAPAPRSESKPAPPVALWSWAEERKKFEPASLARLRTRLAEKGIPWDL